MWLSQAAHANMYSTCIWCINIFYSFTNLLMPKDFLFKFLGLHCLKYYFDSCWLPMILSFQMASCYINSADVNPCPFHFFWFFVIPVWKIIDDIWWLHLKRSFIGESLLSKLKRTLLNKKQTANESIPKVRSK